MTRRNPSGENVKNQAEQTAKQAAAHPWVERLARFGIASQGVVYMVVGILAAQAAFGAGGQTTDTQGALGVIASQPFGTFLLSLVAVGLIGYVMWRFVQAILDPEHKGQDAKGIVQRLGYATSGIAYAGLALAAIQLVLGSGSSNSGNASQGWTARILALPFGRWLVALIGAIVIGVGVAQLYEAYSGKFREQLKLAQMSPTEQTWTTRLGKFGLAARGIVFGIIGLFLIQAALQSNPGKVQGLDGALRELARQPFGPWLLGAVAIGLVAYGIYMTLAQARYRRVVTT